MNMSTRTKFSMAAALLCISSFGPAQAESTTSTQPQGQVPRGGARGAAAGAAIGAIAGDAGKGAAIGAAAGGMKKGFERRDQKKAAQTAAPTVPQQGGGNSSAPAQQ
jgi:hypothetical protein